MEQIIAAIIGGVFLIIATLFTFGKKLPECFPQRFVLHLRNIKLE